MTPEENPICTPLFCFSAPGVHMASPELFPDTNFLPSDGKCSPGQRQIQMDSTRIQLDKGSDSTLQRVQLGRVDNPAGLLLAFRVLSPHPAHPQYPISVWIL